MIKTALRYLKGSVGRFARDRRGNVAIIFGITIIPILAIAGAAVDYSNAVRLKNRLQAAIDATALAVARDQDGKTQAELEQMAQNYLLANFRDGEAGLLTGPPSVTMTQQTVIVTAAASMDTSFMRLVHTDKIDVGVTSEVLAANETFEVALVLDNSGSMSGSKISALKTAAKTLVDALYGNSANNPNLSFALVPFSTGVNIGPDKKNEATATWLDKNGNSPVHSENFSAAANRFDLYDKFTNRSWPGCVEARVQPYDVNDDGDPSIPESLFVPWFAPDEPSVSGYNNSYLNDKMSGSNYDARQKNLAKYVNGKSLSGSRGPGYLCRSEPITDLTNDKQAVKNAIDDMVATDWTNIPQGLVWGWYVLSPGAPFVKGRTYADPFNRKVIILLSDGRNEIGSTGNHNKSNYSAYGFAASGRLRESFKTGSVSSNSLNDALNDRQEILCSNVKAQNIRVYTITFGNLDSTSMNLMKNCATAPELYFPSPTTSELEATFQAIAEDLQNLRLVK